MTRNQPFLYLIKNSCRTGGNLYGEEKASIHSAVSVVKSFVSPDEDTVDVMTSRGFMQDLILRLRRAEISALAAQLAYFFYCLFPVTNFSSYITTIFEFKVDASVFISSEYNAGRSI